MKSSIHYKTNKDMASAAASVSETAKNAAARLDILGRMNKLEILHQYDYVCCGVCLRSHKYAIHNDHKELIFTGIQQLYRFGASNYSMGSGAPLLVYQFSQGPILEMHFGTPGLLEFSSSSVAVTLPSEVLIGSLTKEEKSATVILGSTTTTLRAFDFDGLFLYTAKPGGKTLAEESIHNVVMNSSRIAKIRSSPGCSILEFKKEEITPDVRALLLATAIWLEIIERKKPRWRRQGLSLTRT